MKTGAAFRFLPAAVALFAAAPARGQFVQLARCQAATPCSFPFGLRYSPEPLIAGQYGNVSNTLASVRIDPTKPLAPAIDLSKELRQQDWAREAARIFVLRNPLKPQPTPAPEEAVPTADPEKTPPPKS